MFMAKIGIPLRYSKLEDGRNILFLGERVRRTIQKAGGFIIPIVQVQDVDYYNTKYNDLPPLIEEEKKEIDHYLDLVDGVLFPGGHKITHFDEYLLERCVERNIPTLGICLGMQLMSCYKEDFKVLPNESNINHKQESDEQLTHTVKINKDSKLYEILGKEKIKVNSFHKFHSESNEYYQVVAKSSDGYIEAIELKNQKFNIGIQWHPEISYDFDDDSKKIIDAFIKECDKND